MSRVPNKSVVSHFFLLFFCQEMWPLKKKNNNNIFLHGLFSSEIFYIFNKYFNLIFSALWRVTDFCAEIWFSWSKMSILLKIACKKISHYAIFSPNLGFSFCQLVFFQLAQSLISFWNDFCRPVIFNREQHKCNKVRKKSLGSTKIIKKKN